MAAPMEVDSDDAWRTESDNFAIIFHELENDVQKNLHASFLGSGRGCRPDPPKLPCSNGLLLQIYAMKLESQATWHTVQDWLAKIFPQVKKHRFRKLVEGTVREVAKMGYEDRQHFYATEIDLDHIGSHCSMLGITRETFADPTKLKLPVEGVTNGVVNELYTMCCKENIELTSLLVFMQTILGDECLDYKSFKAATQKLSAEYKKFNKSKSRNNAASALLDKSFTCTSTKHNSCKVSSQPKPVQTSQVKKLLGELETLKEKSETLKLQNSVLQDQIKLKNQELGHMQSSLLKAENENMKLKEKLVDCRRKIVATENELKTTKQKCSAMRQCNYYNKLKRREKELNEKEANLKNLSKAGLTVGSLKKKIKLLQTLLSNQRSVSRSLKTRNKELEKDFKDLKSIVTAAEAEISSRNEHQLETRGPRRQFSDNIRKCVIQLQGENGVAAKHCGPVIQTVAKWLFDYDLEAKDLPSSSSAVNMADEGHILAKYHVVESIVKSDRWDLHADGTSRDHRKIVGQQITTDDGTSLSAGFTSVAVEDSSTLLDVAINLLKDLAALYADNDSDIKPVFEDMLQKLYSTMSDRASKMKVWNKELDTYRKNYDYSSKKPETDLHALHCNAHFLLGLSNQCDQVLRNVEKEIEEQTGMKLGRANLSQFSHFKTSETNASRFVRTACDILGPRGDEKNGCRHEWEAYLKQNGQKSVVTSFRSNRFNNFFLGAATLYHHRLDIVKFISDFKSEGNMKILSVLADAQSKELMALVRILGIVYFKITGPYWELIRSDTNYAEFHVHVQRMHAKFQEWTVDPSSLLDEHSEALFPDFVIHLGDTGHSLFHDTDESMLPAVKQIMQGFVEITERQLSDFLPGGKYGEEPSQQLLEEMRHCKLTNLIGEFVFGDLDFTQKAKRHTSLHHHSTFNMLKRNHTMSKWMKMKGEKEQASLMSLARQKSFQSRMSDRMVEEKVVHKIQKRLEESREANERKMERRRSRKNKVIAAVMGHGGLCKTSNDIVNLLKGKSEKQQLEALKCQFRYFKDILSINTKQVFKGATVQTLQASLNSLVSTNKEMLENSLPFQHEQNAEQEEVEEMASDDSLEENGDSESSMDDSKQECYQFGEFTFTRQGTSVAVAYDQRIYIGQVVNIENIERGTVQFLDQLSGDRFRWPAIDDISQVDKKYVIDSDFDIIPQGRAVKIPMFAEILQKYKAYKKQFM